MKTFTFYTLGCKLNFSESSSISRMFEAQQMSKNNFEDGADIYIINTCSVTENADKKCRKVVKEALKKNPSAFIAIIGCYAQLKPKEIANIPGVDAVLGASEKFKILDLIKDFNKKEKILIYNQSIDQPLSFEHSWSANDRTRTFLKVQDGCDYGCSFCTIPLARGKSRSDSIESIVASAKEIAQTDVNEVVLTGVNIGDFGIIDDVRQESFADLVYQLDEVEGIDRIRISSIEPNLLKDEIIEFVSQSKRFVPHFHIPLQSGSNAVLGLMRRRYRRELYASRIEKIKSLMPHCCIGVDVIVGFPGETEEHFLETYQFLNELDVSYLHVFTYSERNNTHALNLTPVIDSKVRQKRSKMLRILSEKKRRAFYEQHLDSVHDVLFEQSDEKTEMHGFTANYIKVVTEFDPLLVNEIIPYKLKSINDEGLVEGYPFVAVPQK